jgi:hypothetical protein
MISGILKDKSEYIFLFLILISGIILYLPSLSVEFTADEIAFINRNKAADLQEMVGLFQIKEYDGGYYRPLGNFLSGILTAGIGYNTPSYRLFNLLLNALNGVLLFILILKLFRDEDMRKLIALFGALFFIAYPLNDYAVIWHTGLFDRIMALFYLLSLICFLKGGKWMILSLLFFLLSALSKEMAFSLPAVIILFSYLRNGKAVLSFRDSFPYIVLLLALLLFRWLLFDNNILTMQDAHAVGTVKDVIKNLVLFWGMLIFPFFPREIQEALNTHPLAVISGAILIALLIGYFLYKYSRKDIVIFMLIISTTVIILPASRLLMRWYLYLPSAIYVTLLAYILFTSSVRIRNTMISAVVLFGLFYSYTIYRQTVWINVSQGGKSAIESFINDYKEELKNSGPITFLTIPAKVNDIPLFQLGFDHHLNHYLNGQKEIEVISKSYMNNLVDRIDVKSTFATIMLSQTGDNYFILSGNEKNIKFSDEDFNKHRLQRIHYLREKEPEKTIFTFSEGKFQIIKE